MTRKFIDLFCGIGGFHQALKNMNGECCECVFACDIDANCRTIYEKNYGIKPQSDITKMCIIVMTSRYRFARHSTKLKQSSLCNEGNQG